MTRNTARFRLFFKSCAQFSQPLGHLRLREVLGLLPLLFGHTFPRLPYGGPYLFQKVGSLSVGKARRAPLCQVTRF
jgi:hypothetical protein